MENIEAYFPFNGGSIYGIGTVKNCENKPKHNFVFECDSGKIYFNHQSDRQIKGIKVLKNLDTMHLVDLKAGS